MLTVDDKNFLAFTMKEAREIADEFRNEYPNMNVLPVRSNVASTFFENHWMLVGDIGVVVFSSWFSHNRIGKKIAHNFANLL